jgi:hypothetical protein
MLFTAVGDSIFKFTMENGKWKRNQTELVESRIVELLSCNLALQYLLFIDLHDLPTSYIIYTHTVRYRYIHNT